jgi:flagellar M-ring protein FliF
MKAILDGLRALGAARLMALGGVGLAMLAMLALLAVRGGGTGGSKMSLLYADLDSREAGQIADELDKAHIAHQEPGAGDRVLVPSEDVARARVLLAKNGLPSGGSIGYEIFDRGDAMTASDFQQQINQTRAMEGELARSIRMLNGVRAARVHVVLPRREPFAHDTAPAQASVVLTMAGGARLDGQGVQAVLNLVAAAVPGLKPQGISVIDSRGMVLARAGQPAGDDEAVSSGEDMRRATEAKLSRAIEDMLERSLGVGHVRAETAVEMNFEHVNETTETYNPDQQVVRSTQTVTDKNKSSDGEKTTSVQNNLPNADAGATTTTGTADDRNEETTNYEIGKTVRTLVRGQPQIARMSIAVMVDGVTDTGADGKTAWHERSTEELGRIRQLVESAVGFDAKRGDVVNVVSMRFAEEPTADITSRGLLGLGLEKGDVMGLAQSVILGVVVLMTLLLVVRPMAMRLAVAGGGEDASMLTEDGEGIAVAGPNGMRALPAPGGGAGGGGGGGAAEDNMVELANIDGQLRASSMRKLAEMVEKHPDETLSIMRGWMSSER